MRVDGYRKLVLGRRTCLLYIKRKLLLQVKGRDC